MVVRDNVTAILQDSSFLLASELDENVSFKTLSSIWLISFHLTRAAPQTSLTKLLLSLLSNFIILASLTASHFCFQKCLENLYRCVVLPWFAPEYVFVITFLSPLLIFIDCKLFGGMGKWVVSLPFIYWYQIWGCAWSNDGTNFKGGEG